MKSTRRKTGRIGLHTGLSGNDPSSQTRGSTATDATFSIIDLEDFFPSINFGRVRGYFIRDKSFALDEDVATVVAQIACHENALPQGSPCSPVISNLIAQVLDMHLVRLASKVGCTYSRYADDLTFSTNKKVFPAEIAGPSETEPHRWMPGKDLQRIITYSGSGYALDSRRPHTLWSATAATAPSRGHRAAVVGPIAAAHCAPRGDSSG